MSQPDKNAQGPRHEDYGRALPLAAADGEPRLRILRCPAEVKSFRSGGRLCGRAGLGDIRQFDPL